MVTYLLKAELDVNAQDATGDTPLMDAAKFGHFEVAKLLVEDPKMNVTLVNKEGLTAEQIATEHGYDKVATVIRSNSSKL